MRVKNRCRVAFTKFPTPAVKNGILFNLRSKWTASRQSHCSHNLILIRKWSLIYQFHWNSIFYYKNSRMKREKLENLQQAFEFVVSKIIFKIKLSIIYIIKLNRMVYWGLSLSKYTNSIWWTHPFVRFWFIDLLIFTAHKPEIL